MDLVLGIWFIRFGVGRLITANGSGIAASRA